MQCSPLLLIERFVDELSHYREMSFFILLLNQEDINGVLVVYYIPEMKKMN
jgi:hypothetical protein